MKSIIMMPSERMWVIMREVMLISAMWHAMLSEQTHFMWWAVFTSGQVPCLWVPLSLSLNKCQTKNIYIVTTGDILAISNIAEAPTKYWLPNLHHNGKLWGRIIHCVCTKVWNYFPPGCWRGTLQKYNGTHYLYFPLSPNQIFQMSDNPTNKKQ